MDESQFFPNSSTSKTCTHTHTCNSPGPNAAHTHTCYHTHTQVFSSPENSENHYNISSLKPKSPLGNRVAVRKYREKKKAHTAFLEEEVKKLRVVNQDLVRKLHRHDALQAEILSLRALLSDLRGKVDDELGCFEEGNEIGLQCPVEIPCFGRNISTVDGIDKHVFSWQENCQPVVYDSHERGNGIIGAKNTRR